jgi:hypothetical protein
MVMQSRGLRPKSLASLLSIAGGCGVLAGAMPAVAHHSFAAEYDSDQPIDLTGVVTKIRWVNPHSWLYVEVKEADGSITSWALELGSPNILEKVGMHKADVQPGMTVHVRGFHAKSGGPFGYSVTLTIPDGRSFGTGTFQAEPGAPQK